MDLPVIELHGTPSQMGEAFGEACRAEARELYDIRMRCALRSAADNGRSLSEAQVLEVARQCLLPTERYDPTGYEEFRGIGRGAGISLEQVYCLHGLTDLRDILSHGKLPDGMGCSSFMVGADRSATGELILGQTWDLQTDNMPYVRLVQRRPADAPPTCSLTLTGCLSMIGLNSEGIAVGNTNLQTSDARIGVQYLTVLHRALGSRTFAEAVRVVRESLRAGAHYYYVGGPDGEALGLECSAALSVPFEFASGTFAHCNHALSEKIKALQVDISSDSTSFRQKRLTHLLEAHPDKIDVADLKRFMADHEGGALCICRHDVASSLYTSVNTNACVIMSPVRREIHACRGQAHVGKWVTKQI